MLVVKNVPANAGHKGDVGSIPGSGRPPGGGPGASVRSSACGKGLEEGGFGICKGGIEPQETPCSRASTPKTRVYLLFHALAYTSDFIGGYSPPVLSEKELTYSSS